MSKKSKVKEAGNIGIPIKPPEKKCNDAKCPWHGKLSIRGRVFRGVVRSDKSHNTVIVEWGYHRFIPKYERYQRQKSRITAHNPPCIRAREGDSVIVAECRPLSKTKHSVVVGFEKDFKKSVKEKKPKAHSSSEKE
ncbi:MAG: 30S ribosomal protein S17 [Candidatus Aenigmatarchaeota archaeon]